MDGDAEKKRRDRKQGKDDNDEKIDQTNKDIEHDIRTKNGATHLDWTGQELTEGCKSKESKSQSERESQRGSESVRDESER